MKVEDYPNSLLCQHDCLLNVAVNFGKIHAGNITRTRISAITTQSAGPRIVLGVVGLFPPREEPAVVFVDPPPMFPLAILITVAHESAACAPLVLPASVSWK